MAVQLREFRIVDVHPVVPSEKEFDEALKWQWGSGLTGSKLERARQSVAEHYLHLFLIEIEVQPADAEINWSQITQAFDGQPRSNWQAPYDEKFVDRSTGRWTFFLHCVDLTRPISTPMGERLLPSPTPTPSHLASIKYEAP